MLIKYWICILKKKGNRVTQNPPKWWKINKLAWDYVACSHQRSRERRLFKWHKNMRSRETQYGLLVKMKRKFAFKYIMFNSSYIKGSVLDSVHKLMKGREGNRWDGLWVNWTLVLHPPKVFKSGKKLSPFRRFSPFRC